MMWLTLALACSDSREPAGWTVLVWMDGDNDLEAYVSGDLDELERAVVPGVEILVQADRIPGYARGDGDWTGTRRYALSADDTRGPVSPVVEELGEVDMGSPDALAEFLLWGNERAPAAHLALVLWNHGGGFWIASDDTSGSHIGLDGELQRALAPVTVARGAPLEVVAFDACNMGQWETAVALDGVADVLVASQAWVNGGGYAYDLVFPETGPHASPREVADRLAASATLDNDELTHAAVDVARAGALTAAIDDLSLAFLADPVRMDAWFAARDATHGLDRRWEDWWMDLGGFADQVARADDPELAAAGASVRAALDASILANYTRESLSFASGMTLFADTSGDTWVDRYADGPWAATGWDEVVAAAQELETGRD